MAGTPQRLLGWAVPRARLPGVEQYRTPLRLYALAVLCLALAVAGLVLIARAV